MTIGRDFCRNSDSIQGWKSLPVFEPVWGADMGELLFPKQTLKDPSSSLWVGQTVFIFIAQDAFSSGGGGGVWWI